MTRKAEKLSNYFKFMFNVRIKSCSLDYHAYSSSSVFFVSRVPKTTINMIRQTMCSRLCTAIYFVLPYRDTTLSSKFSIVREKPERTSPNHRLAANCDDKQEIDSPPINLDVPKVNLRANLHLTSRERGKRSPWSQ